MKISSAFASLLLTVVSAGAMAATDHSYYVTELAPQHKFDVYNDGRNTFLQSVPGLVITGATADGEFFIVRGVPSTIRGQMNGQPITVVRGTAPVPRLSPQDPAALTAQIKKLDERLCVLTNGPKAAVVCGGPNSPEISLDPVTKDQAPVDAVPAATGAKSTLVQPQAESKKTWRVTVADRSIRAALERWTKEAGYQLFWEYPEDLEQSGHLEFTATFDDALLDLMKTNQASGYSTEAIIYDDNKAVRVGRHTPQEQ